MFGQDVWVLMPQSKSGRGIGYWRISLTVSGGSKSFFVHRLMLQAFLRPGTGNHCNHIDGDKNNNSIDNLEWTTPAENIRHYHDVLKNEIISVPEYRRVRGL